MSPTPSDSPHGATDSALDSSNVLTLAASCLDKDAPNLNTAWEAIALVGHACMVAVDFRLIGLGEDRRVAKCPYGRASQGVESDENLLIPIRA
ncbi:hypothetical protein CISG_09007 [Coccidioides immitis RMSCC 3703]|uniref:PI31 proteasome regulator N-terminal domain-containing protein n=1 Tax=Coccidioides immitis RMSCC 3703 TaxID=454286 RepID=A0A0J8U3J5_COCIT|nr:hypothetical protein CISG_09007 [Coccidioides immitis RMSCC 3703]